MGVDSVLAYRGNVWEGGFGGYTMRVRKEFFDTLFLIHFG